MFLFFPIHIHCLLIISWFWSEGNTKILLTMTVTYSLIVFLSCVCLTISFFHSCLSLEEFQVCVVNHENSSLSITTFSFFDLYFHKYLKIVDLYALIWHPNIFYFCFLFFPRFFSIPSFHENYLHLLSTFAWSFMKIKNG